MNIPDPQRIAETVSNAWYRHYGRISGDLEVVVGVVAALTLLHEGPGRDSDPVKRFAALSPAEFAELLREVWALWWIREPYLATIARPLSQWLDDDPHPDVLTAAREVGLAALRAGLLQLTGADDAAARAQTDVLGAVLTHMRSADARSALGEFHTPASVAQAMATLTMSELPSSGAAFADDCAGSGGLLRALAQRIRQLGGDPTDYTWSMGELNPLAAACCAVNAYVWGLGSDVLVFTGNTLAVRDSAEQAARRRGDIRDHHARWMTTAKTIAALRWADIHLTATGDAEQRTAS